MSASSLKTRCLPALSSRGGPQEGRGKVVGAAAEVVQEEAGDEEEDRFFFFILWCRQL
jgi:hypothetical protein